MPAKIRGYALPGSAVRYILFFIFFCSLPFSLSAVPSASIPALPEATTIVLVSTATISLPIPQSQELPDRTSWRKNPFMPLLGITREQKIKVATPTAGPTDTIQLRDMELVGILKDEIEYSGIFKNNNNGRLYVTSKEKLMDQRKRIMKNVLVAYVDGNKVVLKQGKNEEQYLLKKVAE